MKKPFSELGLSPALLKAVERMGFEEASPIQAATIPVLMAGHDVVGQSQTGSGKTAAFAIPAIEKVDPAKRVVQVLILCPTRELCVQVAEEVAKLASFKKGVRELPIYGGASYERQFRGLQEGTQIVIGTPGRVIDHLERGTLSMEHVHTVILDEADRMLDMGFRDEMERILSDAKPDRQTVLFSATMPPPIRAMVQRFTRDVQHIKIEALALTAPEISQVYYEVDRRSKVEVLCRLIDIQDIQSGIIFCATKAMVDELTEHLTARGYAADRLHGDVAQSMRERVIRRFRERKVELLVATDVAARGLDVDDVEVVFNFDLPRDAEDYVHRIGRTGRAGRSGHAVTFVAGRELWRLQQFIRTTRGKIQRQQVPTVGEVEQRKTTRLFDNVREILEKGEFKRFDSIIDELLDAGHSATDIASAMAHLYAQEKERGGEEIVSDDSPRSRRDNPRYEGRDSRDNRDNRDSRDSRDNRGGRDFGGDRPAPRPRVERPPVEAREGVAPTQAGDGEVGEDAPLEDALSRADRPWQRGEEERQPLVSHEPGMTRLEISLGRENKVQPKDIVGFFTATLGIRGEAIGAIHLQPRSSLVDVADDIAADAVRQLDGQHFKGRKMFVRIAGEKSRDTERPRAPRAADGAPRKPKRKREA